MNGFLNKFITLSVALFIFCGVASGDLFAQIVSNNDSTYTVIANPGGDASRQMRINWHITTDNTESYCFYTKASDTLWRDVKKVKADLEICSVFDSIYSKSGAGENIYETEKFYRCGAELKRLKPATQYMYRVGRENSGELRYFKTAPRSGKAAIGIISDFHAYTPLPKRVTAAMTMIDTLEARNGAPLDMMIHVGDICAWGASYSFWNYLYEQDHFKHYMWAGVNGNHDDMDRTWKRCSNNYFRYMNNNPLNGYNGEEGVCYHFRYGSALFIMLNSENMRTEEGLAAAQKWVREVIRKNRARFVIVVEHYQWFFGGDGKSSQISRWSDLFDECGVDLAIGGNNHIYVRTNGVFGGKEVVGVPKGTLYIQTPSADNERGQGFGELTHNQDIIRYRWSEGGSTIGALLMHLSNDRIEVSLYNRYGEELDSVVVL